MAKKNLVGVEVVSYTSKKTGKLVQGVRIYVSQEIHSPGYGISVTSEFVSGAIISDFPLGPIKAVLYEPGFGSSYKCVGVLYEEGGKK